MTPYEQGFHDELEGNEFRFYSDAASAEQYATGRRAAAIPPQEIYEPPMKGGENNGA